MSQGVRKGSIYALMGQGVSGIFLFLFQTFAGRWLGVESYGLLNVLYSSIIIVTVLVVFGVTQGVTRFIAFYQARNDKKGEEETIQTSFIIYLILLFAVILICYLVRKLISQYLFNNSSIIFYQFILGIVFLSIYRFYNGVLQGYRKFHIFSIGLVIKAITMFFILFLIARFLKLSKIASGWSIVISPILAILFFQFVTKKPFTSFRWRSHLKLQPEIIKFIMIGTFISLMNMWIMRSGPVLLKIVGEAEADKLAGLFSAIMIPLNLARTIVIALFTALYPNLSRAYSLEDKNLIQRYVFKSIGIVGIIIIFLIPIYYFFGPQIVRLLFGEEFIVSKIDSTLLAFAFSFYFIALLQSKILLARNTPKYSAFSLLLGITGMFVTLYLANLSPMKLIAASLLVCNFLYVTIQGIYLRIVKIQK
ncbi:MAG: oligosaccharide flippase family protein [candidate division WOR-3 bacterium]|nr:oligosaccharide flippase family protein [candidate division WOR-3 bacterium]